MMVVMMVMIMIVVVVVVVVMVVIVVVVMLMVRTASVKGSVITLPVDNDCAVASVTAMGAGMLRVVIATLSNMNGRIVDIEIGLMLRPLHSDRFLIRTGESRFMSLLLLLSLSFLLAFLLLAFLLITFLLLTLMSHQCRHAMRRFHDWDFFTNGGHSVCDLGARYGGGIDRERVLRNGGERDKDGENGKLRSHENHVEWCIRS